MRKIIFDDRLLGDVVHGFRQVTNIARGDSSHGNSAILNKTMFRKEQQVWTDIHLSEVNGVVLDDVANLLSSHASEAEHSNLVDWE